MQPEPAREAGLRRYAGSAISCVLLFATWAHGDGGVRLDDGEGPRRRLVRQARERRASPLSQATSPTEVKALTASLVALLLVGAIPAVVPCLLIARDLERRGVPVRFVWLRLMSAKHVRQCSKSTREGTPRVGSLLYRCVVLVDLAAALATVFGVVTWIRGQGSAELASAGR